MFNPTEFQKQITELLFNGKLEEAEEILDRIQQEIPTSEKVRIDRLKILHNQISNFYNKKYPDWQRIDLKDVNKEESNWNITASTRKDLFSLDFGAYQFTNESRLRSWFDQDFASYNERFKRHLRRSRFHVPIETIDNLKFRIWENVRICCLDPQLYAYTSNGYFVREQSGRLAKACGINYIREAKEELDCALMLPIPHLYGNYFHVLSEMFYGLRFVKWVPEDTKIIIGPDNFNLLPFFISKLKIKKERFISIDKCQNLLIKKAIIPSHPNYFWDSGVFEFYHAFSFPKISSLKLYISRSLSSRSLPNETNLETELQKHGFIVLHNEYLSFEEQIFLFSQAEVIVAPHGAGETNILFVQPNIKLIELFSENFLCRDYYLRSRHLHLRYSLETYSDKINISSILEKIDK